MDPLAYIKQIRYWIKPKVNKAKPYPNVTVDDLAQAALLLDELEQAVKELEQRCERAETLVLQYQ